jgi:hypothetical protein
LRLSVSEGLLQGGGPLSVRLKGLSQVAGAQSVSQSCCRGGGVLSVCCAVARARRAVCLSQGLSQGQCCSTVCLRRLLHGGAPHGVLIYLGPGADFVDGLLQVLDMLPALVSLHFLAGSVAMSIHDVFFNHLGVRGLGHPLLLQVSLPHCLLRCDALAPLPFGTSSVPCAAWPCLMGTFIVISMQPAVCPHGHGHARWEPSS